jgi:hypothetical protein
VSVPKFEERREFPSWVPWVLMILSSVATLAWGAFVYLMVPDTPRQWNLGDLPDVPGESIYSSQRTPLKFPPSEQIAPLPEARSRDAGRSP